MGMTVTFNVCIVENDKGNVDLTISRELSNYPLDMQRDYQPMRIINLPKGLIGGILQHYYELEEIKDGNDD